MTEKGEGRGQEKEVCQEKRGCPARGKRYSPAQKQEILEYALAHDVQAAAEKSKGGRSCRACLTG